MPIDWRSARELHRTSDEIGERVGPRGMATTGGPLDLELLTSRYVLDQPRESLVLPMPEEGQDILGGNVETGLRVASEARRSVPDRRSGDRRASIGASHRSSAWPT